MDAVQQSCTDVIASVLGTRPPPPFAREDDAAALKRFGNDKLCMLLRAAYDGKSLYLCNESGDRVPTGWPKGCAEVFLTKQRPGTLDAATLAADIIVSSAPSGVVDALYSTLHNVYAPALLSGGGAAASATPAAGGATTIVPRSAVAGGGGVIDDKTRGLLSELDTSLGLAVRKSSTAAAGSAAGAGGRTGGAGAASSSSSSSSLAGITCLADELRLWEATAKTATGRERERAALFADALRPIAGRVDGVSGAPLAEVVELFGSDVSAALDGVYRARLAAADRYSPARMRGLLDVISASLVAGLRAAVGGKAVWTGPAAEVRAGLRDAARACEAWLSAAQTLTGEAWVTGSGSGGGATPLASAAAAAAGGGGTASAPATDFTPWPFGTYTDTGVGELWARIEEVASIRATRDEMALLLTPEQRKEARLATSVAPLAASDPLSIAAFPPSEWASARALYEKRLETLETTVSNALRIKLRVLADAPHQLSAEVRRFSGVLSRKGVSRALVAEREAVLATLRAELDAMDTELRSREAAARAGRKTVGAPAPAAASAAVTGVGRSATSGAGSLLSSGSASAGASGGPGSSAYVADIAWAQALRGRTAGLSSACTLLLRDLPAYGALVDSCKDVDSRLQRYQQDALREWVRACEAGIASGALSLQASGRVIEFDADGNVVVRYTEGMVTLLRDVRRLAELGLPVPDNIRAAAADAERFYRLGLQLHKVASFYNTLGSEIIAVQKPLLLEPLMAFEKLVQDGATGSDRAGASAGGGGSGVTWSDPKQANLYVESLQRSAEALATQNRRLRALHTRLVEEVSALMQRDMLRQREAWKAQWNGIRETVAAVCKGFSPEQTSKWLRHWDWQIYKALEAGYRQGLESLNEHLSEIKVELVMPPGARTSSFRPGLEEVRAAYYKEMRAFVAIPFAFPGLTGSVAGGGASPGTPSVAAAGAAGANGIFAPMAQRNAASLASVYRKAEILFARLGMVRERLKSWTGIALIDIDTFVEQHVTSIPAFEATHAAVKARRRDLERLPDTQKVDCVSVNLAPFKAAVDMLLQRILDALVLSLRRLVLTNTDTVEKYLEDGIAKMSARPSSLAEIARAQKHWRELTDNRPNMKDISTQCEDQRKLLTSMAAGALDVSDILARLSRLPALWDAFDAALDGFSGVVEDQRATLRGNVTSEARELEAQIAKATQRWAALKPGPDSMRSWSQQEVKNVLDLLAEWSDTVESLRKNATSVQESCESFGAPRPAFEGLVTLEVDFNATAASWNVFRDYHSERMSLANVDWISFRPKIFELQDFCAKWGEVARGDGSKGAQSDVVLQHIAHECEAIRKAFNGLKYARGEPFKEEHWSSVFKKLNMAKGLALDSVNVGHFLEAQVLEAVELHTTWLKDLHSRAQGEVALRDALREIKAWLDTTDFKLFDHVSSAFAASGGAGAAAPLKGAASGGRKTSLIREWRELFTQVGDNQALLSSLKDSPYYKPFADTAAVYEGQFSLLDECCQRLNMIQRRWVYLEPVFGRGALPSEQPRFRRVDEDYRSIMSKIGSELKVSCLADSSLFGTNLKETLDTLLDQLERCQRALSDFLEERRSTFPRFYFIGDDDLLEILGQGHNPEVIQQHLKKLYQGVNKVAFGEQATPSGAVKRVVTEMISSAGEAVPLKEPVLVVDDVTTWLNAFTTEMIRTLAELLLECLASGASWDAKLAAFPSQIHCLAEQISFTTAVEKALTSGGGPALAALKASVEAQLAAFTAKDFSKEPLLNAKVKALILDTVHNLDVCDQLIAKDVKDSGSWIWQKQLRYYVDSSRRAVCKMVDATVAYTYEYQGNTPKLVHTPLTDKCYMVLTQAISQGLGGNPYGPAGTGKTESVKALGAAVGRQVLVFNCDEGIDFQSMGRILMGIVKCGAWGCFDEFNRLKEDQLSAISQQIQLIQAAIKERAATVPLLGRDVDVNFNAGVFVTLNPAGKGYGGRSKLPDNLKQLFRPVAMTKPDNDLIAEVILYSEGFMTAKDLGRKVVSIFSLSSQLLSSQQHYDWGLRSMKTVLNTGGSLIQQWRRNADTSAAGSSGAGKLTPEQERDLLIKAIRVNTLSKLTFDDNARFTALLGDIFPGAPNADISDPTLEEAIKEVMRSKAFQLEHDPSQVVKMLQLKEALDQRIGCLVVGPSGCGKSALWRVLQAALIKTGQTIVTHVMNPKSMPRSRLLGEMDHDTREWTDGVLTSAARQVVKEPSNVRSWIVCDGDVDPEWIESLNSVLDDNHLLTLPNGERISFGSNVNFLFETHDLKYASPATISRMGLIFLSDDDVDVSRIVNRWISMQPAGTPEETAARDALNGLVSRYFNKALDYVRAVSQRFAVETTLVGTVMNALSHLAGCSTKSSFCVGLIRGFGSNLDIDTRSKFAMEVYSWLNEKPPDAAAPLDVHIDGGALRLMVAGDRKPGAIEEELAPSDVLSSSLVPTMSMLRAMAVIAPWMERAEPFIVVGPEGSGKSTLIRHVVAQRRNTSVTVLHCNAQTSAEHVINKIRQLCVLQSSTSGRVYRPREGDRLVLYLKDVNLPKPDKYGTCALVAFIQQLLTFHGFYDANREFLGVERLHIIASMAPSSSVGRHALSTRFAAIVRNVFIDYPNERELQYIYGSYMHAAFGTKSPVHVSDDRFRGAAGLAKLASTMVGIHQSACARFSPDEHRHYRFTPRDLSAWVRGLMRYNVSSDSMLDAVGYEACRVYRDRLVDADARSRFDGDVSAALRSQWGHSLDTRDCVFASLLSARSSGAAGAASADGAAGGSKSATAGAALQVGAGLARMSLKDFRALVQRGLTVFEREERDLSLELFPEALEAMATLDRIVTSVGGCGLLVGPQGVGRRSAATLMAHMHGVHFCTPLVGRGYGVKSFFADLKTAMATAGVAGEEALLYMEDHHLADSGVLECVNSLLASGEVPGLYTHEELEQLLAPLKELIGELGYAFKTPYEYFTHRIRAKLHIVIGMDPSHPEFGARCERNPALLTRCSLVWMAAWRKSSMVDVAAASLQEVKDMVAPHAPIELLAELCAEMHTTAVAALAAAAGGAASSARAPPRDFVSFLRLYKALYRTKAGGSTAEIQRLRGGLGTLQMAQEGVDELRRSVGGQREELHQKQDAADKAMVQITEALAMASDRRKEVEVLQNELALAEKETRARKAVIEEQLADVMPLVEQAKAAVGNIKKENLDEIKSFKMPPEPIADVLSAVLLLLGIDDTSWLSMKNFLSGRGVKERILSFDAASITPKMRVAVGKILKDKAASFQKETITRASVAAAPLADWVVANVQYSSTLEKIAPLRKELDAAEDELKRSQDALDVNQAELQQIDARVQGLKNDFAQRTAEAEALKLALAKTEDVLRRAQQLLMDLSGERERWRSRADELSRAQATMPLQALVGAGFLTYLGGRSEDARSSTLSAWLAAVADTCARHSARGPLAAALASAAGSLKVDPLRLLATESETLLWKAAGLPSDDLSLENAAIILHNAASGGRVPYIIDPGQQATAWLQKHLESDKTVTVEVLSAQDARFQNLVELAVRFGKTLLIRDIDRVDPMLYPLLRRDFIHQGPRSVVFIGDKQVDVHEKFRLFCATRNPRPDLPPDASALICEVNFTVTRSGLESQLLGTTIQHEQPELEAQKSEQLKREEDLRLQLVAVEQSLLEALASSTGNLLDDARLLATLAAAKTKAQEIASALEISERAAAELDRQRDVYRPFAAAGSRMFFALQGLRTLNNMYQYSLAWFVGIFVRTLQADDTAGAAGGFGGGAAGGVDARVTSLRAALEQTVYVTVGQSLFKADRLMFAIFLAHEMHPAAFAVSAAASSSTAAAGDADSDLLWRFFMGEAVAATTAEGGAGGGSSVPIWVPRDRAGAFRTFAALLPDVVKDCGLLSSDSWSSWMRSETPERMLPPEAMRVTSPFLRVVLVQLLRPDRMLTALQGFAVDTLRLASINPPSVSMHELVARSNAATPILLVTTAGADPTSELAEHAAATIGREAYGEMAMGGGVQEEAIRRLKKAAAEGRWLVLKNLHLVTAWLPTLEKELGMLTPNPDFRLWLTTESHPNFPAVLLQASLKVTFEAPPGLKKNMERTYQAWGRDFLAGGSPLRNQLLFMLAWLNAVVQERRTYVPQGWTKAYEFSFGDLRAGASVICAQLARAGERVPWAYLHGLIENTVYGGRVDNPHDLRILRAYLATIFHPDVVAGRNGRMLARGLALPASTNLDDYTGAFAALPDMDAPVLFGLPDNIDRSVQRVASAAVVSSLKLLGADASDAGGFRKEVWTARLGPLLSLWEKISGEYVQPAVTHGAGAAGAAGAAAAGGGASVSDPVREFILHECSFASSLMAAVKRDLSALQKVLAGTMSLSSNVVAVGAALLQDTVPEKWAALWDGPEQPIPWLKAMMQRQLALPRWAAAESTAALLAAPLRLQEVFRPGTLLNAIRQYTARKLRAAAGATGVPAAPLDTLKLVSAWGPASLPAGSLVFSATGLFLQGALFDVTRQSLADVGASSGELQLVPDVTLAWVSPETPDPCPPATSLIVPVYQGLDRAKTVMDIQVPCGADKAHWVLAGVAMFLEPE